MRRLRRAISGGVTRVWRNYHMRRRVIGMQRHLHTAPVPVDYAEARRYWRQHFGVNICTRWHELYARSSGRDDPRYVPEDVFYATIMPVLNVRELSFAWADKNLYRLWLPEEVLPEAMLRCIHGRFYTRDLESIDRPGDLPEDVEYFIKPSLDTGNARNIEPLRVQRGVPQLRGIPWTWDALRSQYSGDFVLQKRLQQHAGMAALNASSINTLRIISMRLGDEYWVPSAVVRIGRAGSHVDNLSTGNAMSCGIMSDGHLNPRAIDKDLNPLLVHPDAGYQFGGQQIPAFDAAKDFVTRLHHRLPYFDLVAWDISVGLDGQPRVVEANLWRPGVNLHQAGVGPLFGDRTDEVLRDVRGRRN